MSTKAAKLDAEALGSPDLLCSGCKLFIETYHSQCASGVFPLSVQKMYEERMKAIFKEKGMSAKTSQRMLHELFNSPGQEHKMYLRLCSRKEVECAEEYRVPKVSPDFSSKLPLALKALEDTVAAASDPAIQWSKGVVDGKASFMDFQKAMNIGGVMDLSMGKIVTDQLSGIFRSLADEHRETLASDIAQLSKIEDSGLDGVFCTQVCADADAMNAEESASVKDEI